MHAAGWTGLASLVAGLAGGTLAGLFGVGGGMVLIPILGLTLGLDQHQAQGVALAAMLLPNGLPAVIYMKRQGIPIHAALVTALTLGFLPAVWVGAAIATRIPEPRLRLGFACVLVLLSARTLLRNIERFSGGRTACVRRIEPPRRRFAGLDEAGVMAKRYGFSVALSRLSEQEMAGIRGHGSMEIGAGTGGIGAATPLFLIKQAMDLALSIESGPSR